MLAAFGKGSIAPFLTAQLQVEIKTAASADAAVGLHAQPLLGFEVAAPANQPADEVFVPATLSYDGFTEGRVYKLVAEDGDWHVAGSRQSAYIPTWDAPTPAGIRRDANLKIANAAVVAVDPNPARPIMATTIAIAGDYAAVLIKPHSSPRTFAFLERTGDGWQVRAATETPTMELLREHGIPEHIANAGDMYTIAASWMDQLQDERGAGLSGYVVVEAIEGDFARVVAQPADPAATEPFTAFLQNEGTGWKQLIGGTAFRQEDLAPFGIPDTLWPVYE